MLEHQKNVLNGVVDFKELFRKELMKSMLWLNVNERTILIKWVCDNFRNRHPEIYEEVLCLGHDCIAQSGS
ncbi:MULTISPECIES: hypothetical protein [unclassified Saccharicrinis]|uniref:hypothetical protein n=1 Tax=unclassified Saccharicrinis TaxID=2646859 RepID=UPI003D33408B